MDISKLPRLSKTDAPPAADPADAAAAPAETFAPPTSAAPAGYCQCGSPLRAGARFCDSCGAPTGNTLAYTSAPVPRDAGMGAEVWLSAIIGLVLILLGRSFGQWLLATATGQTYHTNVTWTAGEKAGQEVGYWELDGFTALNDSAIFLFGVAMVLEAVVLALVATRFKRKVALVSFALAITVLATVYNLYASIKLLTVDVIPLWSLLAVAFGGYIAMFEWRLLQQLRPVPVAPASTA